jgi:outer membrane receptor protein involved in Fe transport
MLDDRLSLLGGLLSERSSLDGDTDKYYFYPKLGAAYSLIKPAKPGEAAMFSGFESLRVRAAYGETGNRPNYGQKFTPLSAVNTIGGSTTLGVIGTAGFAKIEPERQREIEGGIDMATKDQRVVAEVTGYNRQISNMLLSRALATSTGFNTQFLNGGGMRNRGVEAAVAVKPVKEFDWTTRATLTLNRSMVTELPAGFGPFNTGPSFGAGFGTYRIEVGKSATQIVSTTDGTGKLSVVGDGEPSFRIGWSNVINVGDFSFSTLLDWQQGSKVINLTQNYFDANGNATDLKAAKMRTDALDNGDPRPYIEDGTFLKVREVSVAYSLPRRLASQLGPVRTLQVSLSGRNLLTLTHYSGLDPEVSNFGSQAISRNYDVTPYPPSRTFWLSVTAGI